MTAPKSATETVESVLEVATKYQALAQALQTALDQLIEDYAYTTGIPRDELIVRYLGPVVEVTAGR